ncbi:MAG: OsmC family peroxiredoxin [Candidatus Eremiobacteraeota bacterium]|nr:OsmC family peroxiredoxin [Candidatus Eremiobacteraeota bacterium]MCW5866090.1 OsmC family peroxiredoxin [Candidatus Eremiobacteraeota bacterium]
MPVNQATATWKGDLMHGAGHIVGQTGAIDVTFSLKSRSENTSNTNPEELIGAAHSGCYSMMLSALLTKAGKPPEEINTVARVTQEMVNGEFLITKIELSTRARVAGLGQDEFLEFAENAKKNCPVSRALTGTNISLEAELL